MVQKIAIIGANEFQNPLIQKAKNMGLETHAFAWQTGDIGEKTADFFYPISITEKEKILDKCREIGISSVTSIASDLAVLTVNYIARALGFPCNSEWTDSASTNKYLMRKAFKQAGIPTPKFMTVDLNDECVLPDDFIYPVIVKPTDRSGSRGVNKVNAPSELKEAVIAACGQSFSGKAIIEEYIEGPEYSCECINWNGHHKILAYTKKYTTNAPHFIETGHDQPADIPEDMLPAVDAAMLDVLDALKIVWGAAHIEFRISPDGTVRIIEAGARMGGDCIGSDLVELSTGYDFLRMVIDASYGRNPDFTLCQKPVPSCVRFIMNEEDLTKFEKIRQDYPGQIWRASKFQIENKCIVDSASRFGYYILRKE